MIYFDGQDINFISGKIFMIYFDDQDINFIYVNIPMKETKIKHSRILMSMNFHLNGLIFFFITQ